MNVYSGASGLDASMVDPLTVAALRALDVLQAIHVTLSTPQAIERAAQLEAVGQEVQLLICKIVKLIEPMTPSHEPMSSGGGSLMPLIGGRGRWQ